MKTQFYEMPELPITPGSESKINYKKSIFLNLKIVKLNKMVHNRKRNAIDASYNSKILHTSFVIAITLTFRCDIIFTVVRSPREYNILVFSELSC